MKRIIVAGGKVNRCAHTETRTWVVASAGGGEES